MGRQGVRGQSPRHTAHTEERCRQTSNHIQRGDRMSVIVRVPGSLKQWFHGSDQASCSGGTLGECIDHLDGRFPGLRDRLVNEEGGIAAVLIFLNGENVTSLDGLATTISDGDEIGIIPFAAGG